MFAIKVTASGGEELMPNTAKAALAALDMVLQSDMLEAALQPKWWNKPWCGGPFVPSSCWRC